MDSEDEDDDFTGADTYANYTPSKGERASMAVRLMLLSVITGVLSPLQ